MSKSKVLRVGICGCTYFYHGEFVGRTFSFTSLGGEELSRPVECVLQEVHIPEQVESRFTYLRQKGCHFFLDVIEREGTLFPILTVELEMFDLNSKYGWSVARGGFHQESLEKFWRTAIDPPISEEIISTMQNFITTHTQLGGRRKLNRWIKKMHADS
jgi:hypothetical protein